MNGEQQQTNLGDPVEFDSKGMKRVRLGFLPSHFIRLAARWGPSWFGRSLLPADASLRTIGPVILFRVDDFPAGDSTLSEFAEFNKVFEDQGIPYTLGVTPWYEFHQGRRRLLDAQELQYLKELTHGGSVQLALHGFTHSRRLHRGYETEVAPYTVDELRHRIASADAWFRGFNLPTPQAFIPPFNTITRSNFAVLCKRFKVIMGGSPALSSLGKFAPQKWMGTIYLPSYSSLYGTARSILKGLSSIRAFKQPNVVAVHWTWERASRYADLRDLIQRALDLCQVWSLDQLIEHFLIPSPQEEASHS